MTIFVATFILWRKRFWRKANIEPKKNILTEYDGEKNISSILVLKDRVLGYGSNGTVVFEGEYLGRPVAVKRVLSEFCTISKNEIDLLEKADHHPNIIRMFYSEKSEHFTFIALDLCVCSLADISCNSKDFFSNVQISPVEIMRQATKGLEFLHKNNLIHRDIKPQNILITKTNCVVISDFGLGKQLIISDSTLHSVHQSTQNDGSVGWRAPEVLMSNTCFTLATDKQLKRMKTFGGRAQDIFSLGCVFYYLLCDGKHAFGDILAEREVNIINGKANLSFLHSRNPIAFDLLQRMLQYNASLRPNCEKILCHPMFWSSTMQAFFLQDVSDIFEADEGEFLKSFEKKRFIIFNGKNVWNRSIHELVWKDLIKYRWYNPKSARDLLRALRNKRNHYQEQSMELRIILGETVESLMDYFLSRFPHLFIQTFLTVECSK